MFNFYRFTENSEWLDIPKGLQSYEISANSYFERGEVAYWEDLINKLLYMPNPPIRAIWSFFDINV